ncbi:short-chain dehydrogenase/reductase SDR [Calothrix sp. NIES-4071]|nr:short-chain dehydrogenase/reductase SDR [Calothrix sp. NIES-4071]BAZ54555.1 short-chain dehydrogenase/reductase SDR [Calothrix sp. NIES-4105]
MKPLCIIVGFGTGVGLGIARAFGQAGFQLGLIARNPSKYTGALQSLLEAGIDATFEAADVSNEKSLTDAISRLQQSSTAEVLIYNVVSPTYGKPTSLDAEQVVQDFRANVVGALVAAKAVVPSMKTQEHGSILFTGGGWAHYPWDEASSISIGKAGLRSLTFTLSQELSNTNVRVGMVSIMGQVAPDTPFDPDKIGAVFLKMHNQSKDEYQTEILFKGG